MKLYLWLFIGFAIVQACAIESFAMRPSFAKRTTQDSSQFRRKVARFSSEVEMLPPTSVSPAPMTPFTQSRIALTPPPPHPPTPPAHSRPDSTSSEEEELNSHPINQLRPTLIFGTSYEHEDRALNHLMSENYSAILVHLDSFENGDLLPIFEKNSHYFTPLGFALRYMAEKSIADPKFLTSLTFLYQGQILDRAPWLNAELKIKEEYRKHLDPEEIMEHLSDTLESIGFGFDDTIYLDPSSGFHHL